MHTSESSMDRPRQQKGTPFTRKLRRASRSVTTIVGMVFAVSFAPVVFLWIFMPEEAVAPTVARVEAPPPGLPPRVETVTFASGVTPMSGVLHVPSGQGPFPAVVIIHGSGRQTADAQAWLGEAFAGEGTLALAYDKRGVGASSGRYRNVGTSNSEETLAVLAEDALAAVAFLRAQDDVLKSRVGLAGISQGGWIAPLAASRSSDVAFMVIYSGPTVSVGEEIYFSDLTGEGRAPDPSLSDAEIARRLRDYDGARGFDPVPSLRALDVPALWLLGELDRSIPVPETVRILEALQDSGKPFQLRVFPGADHSLRDPTGAPVESWPTVVAFLDGLGLS